MDNAKVNTNSTNSELVKNYKFLFTIPKSDTLSISLATFTYLINPLVYLLVISPPTRTILESILVIAISFFIILYSMHYILTKRSKIASIRRISFSLTFTNTICSLVFVAAIYLHTQGISAYYLLTTILQLSINLLLISSLFVKRLVNGFVLSSIISLPQLFVWYMSFTILHVNITKIVIATSTGFILVLTIIITLRQINVFAIKAFNTSTLNVLRSFLVCWMNGDSTELEKILETRSEEITTLTWLIHLQTGSGKKLAILIPYIHPGPFYPVGSYNLPEELAKFFKSRGYDHCFVLHGPVDHNYNLSSRGSVLQYLKQLEDLDIQTKTPRISAPLYLTIKDIKIAYHQLDGKRIVYLSGNEKGLEDYPPDFVSQILENGLGEQLIIVDSHNSIGPTPDIQLVNDLVNALKSINSNNQENSDARVAFTTVNKEKLGPNEDVGANGIGILLMEIEGKVYAMISIDANNALPSIKSSLMNSLQKLGIELIDVTTSDTHFNATKIRNSRGYYLFGEKTSSETFVSIIAEACDKLSRSLERFEIGIKMWKNTVRRIDPSTYGIFRNIIRSSLNSLKKCTLVLSITLIVGLLLISLT